MTNNNKCPKCSSNQIKIIIYMDQECFVCQACNYDNREEFEESINHKKSNKQKSNYSIYKSGGPRRTIKKSD